MGTLHDDIREFNEQRQIELDQKQNTRVRAMQLDLAEDVEFTRTTPATLQALAKEHRAALNEAQETLNLIHIAMLTPQQGEIVNTVRNRVHHALTLLSEGGAIAERAVSKVDGLTFEQIKSWSPAEYARALRNDLRSASSAPQVVKAIVAALPLDMESIRRLMRDGPRKVPMGQAAIVERDVPVQAYARSHTQGT